MSPMRSTVRSSPRRTIGGLLTMFAALVAYAPHYSSAPSPSIGTPVGSPARDSSATVTAFVDVAVIPMDREQVLTEQTVLVQSGRISALGPRDQVKVPAGAVVINVHVKFLIPGFFDIHVNLQLTDSAEAERVLFLFLANGVTTVRNVDYYWPMSAQDPLGFSKLDGESLLRFRARAAAGELLSPRIYTSGPWHVKPITVADSSEMATVSMLHLKPTPIADQIAEYKAAGYDFIKIHDEDPHTYDSVVAAAHRVGIPVVGHIPEGVGLEQALKSYRSIEHLFGYVPYLMQGEGSARTDSTTPDTSRIRAIAVETQRAGVWNCPTQAVKEILSADTSYTLSALSRWPEVRYASANTRALWDNMLQTKDPPRTLDIRRRVIKALQDAGAGLLAGTDAPFVSYLVPGFSLHRELEALVRAGLTPYQSLATSTRNVAVYFGTLNESGTVAVGKRADLVLLQGNPLKDIGNVAHPAGVMIGGRWFARDDLDRRMAAYDGTLDIEWSGH